MLHGFCPAAQRAVNAEIQQGTQHSLLHYAGLLRRLHEQSSRPTFRTFSSGGGGSGAGGGSGGGGGGGGGSGGGGGLWVAYLALLEKQPLLTKALTAALLNGLGDVIAQCQFEKGGFNWKRFAIFTGLVSRVVPAAAVALVLQAVPTSLARVAPAAALHSIFTQSWPGQGDSPAPAVAKPGGPFKFRHSISAPLPPSPGPGGDRPRPALLVWLPGVHRQGHREHGRRHAPVPRPAVLRPHLHLL